MLIVQMIGAVSVVLMRAIRHPTKFRWTALVVHIDRVGWNGVPIMLLVTFLIGCIIAQQGIFHFRKFGADIYVVDMVGILTLREARRAHRLGHDRRTVGQRLYRPSSAR